MPHFKLITGLFLSGSSAAFCAISVPATSIYDDTTNANVVDVVAGVGAVSAGSAGESSLNSYKTIFANAFAANTGGVVRFDGFIAEAGDLTPTLNSALAVTYGLGSTLAITRPGGEYQFDNSPGNAALGTPISGNMYLRTSGENFHVFNFGTSLTTVGFTVLSRNSSRTILATVTYFEGGTGTIAGELIDANAADDTFFGFTAPVGKTISSLRIEATATGAADDNRFFVIDDLGFVVAIPEPSVSILGAAGLAGLLIRRRRA